jgi:hypothetical protein
MPSQQFTYLNSTLVKEVARLGGSVRGLVPRGVEEHLRARFGQQAARAARAAKDGAKAAVKAGAKDAAKRSASPDGVPATARRTRRRRAASRPRAR